MGGPADSVDYHPWTALAFFAPLILAWAWISLLAGVVSWLSVTIGVLS
jgi:hypothetical protein